MKQTVFFLAESKNQKYIPQESEIENIALLDFDSAMNLLCFDNFKDILSEADAFKKKIQNSSEIIIR